MSRLAAVRLLGYLQAQQAAMTGQAGAHTNRPELVAVHGYDTSTRCTPCGSGCRAWQQAWSEPLIRNRGAQAPRVSRTARFLGTGSHAPHEGVPVGTGFFPDLDVPPV